MITVVMPYWERYEAAKRTLETYDLFYGDDVKVVIVDDGSPEHPAADLANQFERVTVLSLPVKHEVKNPCVPFNSGAELVTTEYIGLSNPETYHADASLYEMVGMINHDNDYILAPAFCPDTQEWHCHPDLHPPFIPKGTGFHHLGLMKKKLWDKTGGFNQELRDGYCFDDTDFVMRLVMAGANFMYSEMPVFHARNGAKAKHDPAGWKKNHDIFMETWA